MISPRWSSASASALPDAVEMMASCGAVLLLSSCCQCSRSLRKETSWRSRGEALLQRPSQGGRAIEDEGKQKREMKERASRFFQLPLEKKKKKKAHQLLTNLSPLEVSPSHHRTSFFPLASFSPRPSPEVRERNTLSAILAGVWKESRAGEKRTFEERKLSRVPRRPTTTTLPSIFSSSSAPNSFFAIAHVYQFPRLSNQQARAPRKIDAQRKRRPSSKEKRERKRETAGSFFSLSG